ncbi:MAG: NAD(P)/FAD-dependent oxidoreductase [Bacteroidetes bacterium]|nr:NAD(P)/FAD-dependent oxidoreductase [Bacteroidota bacterium]
MIVIGAGASGFFAAINCAIRFPEAKIIMIEKSNKILSKVRISGGGRCNVTNHCFDHAQLVKNYPRGEKELRQVFSRFDVQHCIAWFADRGVKLKTEPDGRMFPVSNSSETIIACFLREADKRHIQIRIQEEALSMKSLPDGRLTLSTSKQVYEADAIICCIGGHAQSKHYDFIKKTGHTLSEPVPSLFTFNLPGDPVCELMGLSVKSATVKILSTSYKFTGPLLITHWGMSGPAVLKLSAFAAIDLYNCRYDAGISVNWTGELKETDVKTILEKQQGSKAMIINTPLFEIPRRLWEYLVSKAGIASQKSWMELGKKENNKLVEFLINDIYHMQGKTTFKEEFVTSGGVKLNEIDFKTMQSKKIPGLYFCGEVLNIDGITGGFNFQNAWSTAWIASQLGN